MVNYYNNKANDEYFFSFFQKNVWRKWKFVANTFTTFPSQRINIFAKWKIKAD